jgi:hypothetical protein
MAHLSSKASRFITIGLFFYDMGNFIFNLPPMGGLEEPIIWESVVAYLEYQWKNLQSITFGPIFLNKIGEGHPDAHDGHTNNLSLIRAGYPSQLRAIKRVTSLNAWPTSHGPSEQPWK